LAYICCTQEQQVEVYVGVAEKPVRQVRTPPVFTGKARLPEDMIRADDEYDKQVREAVSRGQAREDDSQGHALAADYPPLRAVQQIFIDYARDHAALASEVLASSANARHRAVAAVILGYAPDKRAAATALIRGVSDPDDGVRNNATRALGVIATYSVAHPELGIHIDPEPFVEMLNSVVWTDRNKGEMVLAQLTAGREPGLMKLIGKRARPALIDMCRWKNPGHSFQGCLLLRRVEGLPDFSGGDDRGEVLRKVGGN
jgi:HEAT repeat protein